MKKAKPRKAKKSMSKPKSPMAPLSDHPIIGHAERIRGLVNTALRGAGINDLSLQSMQFSGTDSSSDPCEQPNQHREWKCRDMPDGSQVCSWVCVPN